MNDITHRQNAQDPRRGPQRPLQLAYFSPLPPARSGIADYSAELLPHLAQMADLTLFCVDPEAVTSSLHEQFEVCSILDYAKMRWRFDLPIYQMGNNTTYHEEIYRCLHRYPGIVVLHDIILHHFIAHRTIGHGKPAGYTREMGYVLGEAGIKRAWAILHREREHALTELTLNQRTIDVSLGTLAHSKYAASLIHATRPRAPVWVVPQHVVPYAPPEHGRSADSTPSLPWRDDAIVFASVGQITAAKGIDRVLSAFAKLRHEMPRARYLLVGEVFANEVDLPALLQEHDVDDDVHVTGFVPDLQTFMAWLTKADIVISARYPTVGETSSALLRALSVGKPLIVYDHGWYAELPDDVALKIPVLNDTALSTAMRQLGKDEELRRAMGQQALAFAGGERHPSHIARLYMKVIEEVLASYA